MEAGEQLLVCGMVKTTGLTGVVPLPSDGLVKSATRMSIEAGPVGVAHDLTSAWAAMKQGASASPAGVRTSNINPVPAIVFHGDRDTTVDPCNGEAVIAQCIGTDAEPDAARATVESAIERRETRGCHNRSDYPDLDPSLPVNLVWSPNGIVREAIAPVPPEIADLIGEVSTVGKLVE